MVVLASYKNGVIVNTKAENKILTEGTVDYTIAGFEKGNCDVVKAFVWGKNAENYVDFYRKVWYHIM